MFSILYKKGCRYCFNGDDKSYSFLTSNVEDVRNDNGNYNTEFEISLRVEKWLEEGDQRCPNCNKLSWEVWDIEIGESKLFNKNDGTVQFLLIIDRVDNGELEIKTGGGSYTPPGFIYQALKLIKEALEIIPYNRFIRSPSQGGAEIAVSYNPDNIYKERNKLEKFSHAGLSKEEISKAIKFLTDHYA